MNFIDNGAPQQPVCIYVCMYICMYEHVCMMIVCMYVYMYVCMNMRP